MTLQQHSTAYNGIYFAGGDLFSEDILACFDGILGFVYGGFSPLHFSATYALCQGYNKPYVLYGAEHNPSRNVKPQLKDVPRMVWRGLDKLAANGCRKIGFHGAETTDAYYVDGARESLCTICEWMEAHPNVIKSVTLVDTGDDYRLRFGNADFLVRRGTFTIPPTTPFEYYLTCKFTEELHNIFDIATSDDYPFCPPTALLRKINPIFDNSSPTDHTELSVAVFFITLIPQIIAKLTGKLYGLYAFARCADWPVIFCGLGGIMSPYTILSDSGLLPADGAAWAAMAREEASFFEQTTRNVILAYLWKPAPETYPFLREIAQRQIGEIVEEIHRQVDIYTKHFLGGPQPDGYYIEESNFAS